GSQRTRYQDVAFVVLDPVVLQELEILLLERARAMVFLLPADVIPCDTCGVAARETGRRRRPY
ncbi:MAG TPA: hypothetical protein VGE86_07710, partial [Thermoanaerobaculia bacterium]